MELKVKSSLIKAKRQSRAWSQEHLAHVSGLGIRTIQRIESTDSASYDSIQAIASALELPAPTLVSDAAPDSAIQNWKLSIGRKAAILMFSALAATSFFFVNAVAADQVMLNVDVVVNEKTISEAGMIVDEGEHATMDFGDGYRLLISPTIQNNGDIQLIVELSKLDDETYVSIAKPRIVTPNGELALLRSGSGGGDVLDITITPTLQ